MRRSGRPHSARAAARADSATTMDHTELDSDYDTEYHVQFWVNLVDICKWIDYYLRIKKS